MTAAKTWLGLLVSILILLTLPGELAAREKTLGRIDDPVVVEGKALAPMMGAGLDRLSLMVWKADGFKPVPFQVDEKDDKDEYVFTEGDKIKLDSDPNLDANDELIFMVFDAGDRCPDGSAPTDAEKGVELEIVDPVDGGRAWVYLFAFEKDAPHSEKDYVKSIIVRERRVRRLEAKNYIMETVKNAIYYNYLSLIHSDGTRSPDLVDRLKIRCIVSIFFNTIKIPLDFDKLIKTKVTAWKDGPVRVISRGQGYLSGVVKIKLKGHSVVYHYPNFFIFPINLAIPINLEKLLSNIRLHGENDFSENAYGLHYYDKYNPWNPEVVLDGKMSDAEKNMNYRADRDWLVLTGPQGTCVSRILFPKEWNFVNTGMFYVDDSERADPPEDNPGLIAAGYDFDRFIELKKGQATFYLHYYFPQDFKVGDEARILNIMDHPLEVKVHPIK